MDQSRHKEGMGVRMSVEDRMEAGRIVAILRGDWGGAEEEMVAVLETSGVTAVEVTLNSPGALGTIARLAKRFGERLVIGAGTVVEPAQVEAVASAGGQLIVSPNRDRAVIEATRQRGLFSLPGCFTPSEIVEALAAGAQAIKLFPAQSLGVDFLRAMAGPLPGVRWVPTGGVTPEMARAYFAAGAWAVGVGGELFGRGTIDDQRLAALCGRAEAYVAAVREGRQAGGY
jgi:Entner-Doudoroff aldolase